MTVASKIEIQDYTRSELDRIMKAEEHTNYDSVIRALVGNYEVSE